MIKFIVGFRIRHLLNAAIEVTHGQLDKRCYFILLRVPAVKIAPCFNIHTLHLFWIQCSFLPWGPVFFSHHFSRRGGPSLHTMWALKTRSSAVGPFDVALQSQQSGRANRIQRWWLTRPALMPDGCCGRDGQEAAAQLRRLKHLVPAVADALAKLRTPSSFPVCSNASVLPTWSKSPKLPHYLLMLPVEIYLVLPEKNFAVSKMLLFLCTAYWIISDWLPTFDQKIQNYPELWLHKFQSEICCFKQEGQLTSDIVEF